MSATSPSSSPTLTMTSSFSLPVAKPNPKTFRHGKAKVQATAQVIAVPNPKLDTKPISKTDIYQISQVIEKQTRANPDWTLPLQHNHRKSQFDPSFLEEAYESCRDICAHYAKTFYLGTLLMTPERQKAVWAIYVWCRRTDELVDGPNAEYMSTGTAVLDRWEERLEDIFNGRPYDMLDAALTHTVQSFPIDIKPFRDMIEGMRMDIHKSRYLNFEELYRYCYYVAGTVGLMTVPVMGIAPDSAMSPEAVYNSAFYLGIANQLTNILRDVGEDAMRGRVYLPQDELAEYGLSDKDVMARKVSDKWREFMKEQIKRARYYFDLAEEGASNLHKSSRWPVWSCLILYRQILDAIEENDYDNLTKRAFVGKSKKLVSLPLAYTRALSPPTSLLHSRFT